MRYIFDEKIGLSYNASSKARDDIDYFVKRYVSADNQSYKTIGMNDKSKVRGKLGKAILGLWSLLNVFAVLGKRDILFVQSSMKILSRIDRIKKIRRFRVIYLIHDLDALRDRYNDDAAIAGMVEELNRQEVVICHNPKMADELRRRGCTTHLISMDIFDYHTDLPEKSVYHADNPTVIFAGNLSPAKTGFLYQMDGTELPYKVNVYGKKERDFERLTYKGCFPPEQLPEIMEGSYGLIWEGKSDTYDESAHPYIMFNNPHKASLYIVSGLPIIIWEKAALADFVSGHQIGITVANLGDIADKLAEISDEQYSAMSERLRQIRKELIGGAHIHKALRSAEDYLTGR